MPKTETPICDKAEVSNGEFYDDGSDPSGFMRIEDGRRLERDRSELMEALKLYRESHKSCITTEAPGRCNKCRITDALLAKLKETT